MLERLSISHYSSWKQDSENVMSADNQQGRLEDINLNMINEIDIYGY
tara:strand:+ start:163 stop:303 length:141 start_codon:yes stop_codon:yes gene_type:complete